MLTEEERLEHRREINRRSYHKTHPDAKYRTALTPEEKKEHRRLQGNYYYHLKHPNARYVGPNTKRPLTAEELRERQLSYYHNNHPNAKYRKEKEIVKYIVKLKNGYINYIETIAGVSEYGCLPEKEYAKIFKTNPSRTIKTIEKNVGYKPQLIFLEEKK